MIIAVLIVLGLALGSFVNALVWRLHEQAKPKKKRATTDKELSIATGRSMCPHCKHTLSGLDLIPLLSWLWLRGRCRYCKQAIGWQYPLVEFVTAALFVASYIWWPAAFNTTATISFAIWLLALVGLMALLVYDLRWMLLPNRIVYPLIALGVTQALCIAVYERKLSVLIDAGLGLLIAGGIFYVLFQVSNGRWIGGGDVKLGFALGLILGSPSLAFLMLFIASLLGTIITLPGLLVHKLNRTSRVPFGPFLIVAAVLVKLFGQHIIDWYLNHLLYLS